MSERTRAYLYRVALAALAVLAGYGLIGADEVPLWLTLIVALLGISSTGLAVKNTSTDRPPREH